MKGVVFMNINFKADTALPQFLPYPKFLVGSSLSYAAREAYTLLLSRAQLSQKNGWVELGRNVFVIYPVEELAKDMGKKKTRLFEALNELENADLIERKRVIFNGANRILLKIPQFGNTDVHSTEK